MCQVRIILNAYRKAGERYKENKKKQVVTILFAKYPKGCDLWMVVSSSDSQNQKGTDRRRRVWYSSLIYSIVEQIVGLAKLICCQPIDACLWFVAPEIA